MISFKSLDLGEKSALRDPDVNWDGAGTQGSERGLKVASKFAV